MQLYNTKVIPSLEDKMWDVPEGLPSFSGTKLLVISSPYDTEGPESITLGKMMSACRLAATEYVILPLEPSQRISWAALRAAGAPDKTLLLGVTTAQLGLNVHFRQNACNDFLGCTFIPGYPLSQIEQQPAVKRELWEYGLKPCFGL